MRLGIVSDVHGNDQALQHALALMGEVDVRICLGDSIREYRFSNEVVALLRRHDFITILGNHEEVFFGRHGVKARAAPWIDSEHLEWLGTQPARRELVLGGRRVLLVHATPWPGGEYIGATDREFSRFGDAKADVVLYGHTHEPVVAYAGNVLVVNPGSTGEPRLRDGKLETSCAVLDLASLAAHILPIAA